VSLAEEVVCYNVEGAEVASRVELAQGNALGDCCTCLLAVLKTQSPPGINGIVFQMFSLQVVGDENDRVVG